MTLALVFLGILIGGVGFAMGERKGGGLLLVVGTLLLIAAVATIVIHAV